MTWNPDVEMHHPYCQYYRDGAACTCAEGRMPYQLPDPYWVQFMKDWNDYLERSQ
jgi:hypothetical protein